MSPAEPLEGRTLLANFTATSVPDLIADIQRANRTAAADTITLAPGKKFTLTGVYDKTGWLTVYGPTGLPPIAPAGGKLTIVGNGGTIERSAAAGTPAFRLFDVAPGASLALSDLTLQGGLAVGKTGVVQGTGGPRFLPGIGGAIWNGGTLTLSKVTVRNNAARGGVARAVAAGGGIYSSGTLAATGSTFQGNSATGATGTHGIPLPGSKPTPASGGPGGVASGGGLYVAGGTASLSNCLVTGNSARGGTGGKASANPAGWNGTFSNGRGGDAFGGGIYAGGGTLTLRNVRVTANAAAGGSGGSHFTRPPAPAGRGIGGGISVRASGLGTLPSVGLDTFTKANFKLNNASTSHNNVHGPYKTIVRT